MRNLVTVLTVNFKTPELIYTAVCSFREHYPSVPYIVIDNGGCQRSVNLLRRLPVALIENEQNIGHGLALNLGIELVDTPYVFLLDSDTKTEKSWFLELMLKEFEKDSNLFAIGWLRKVNNSGVAYRGSTNKGIEYIHPYACLMDVGKFQQLKPFTQQGAPAINTMRDAKKKGYTVKDFPIAKYIFHKVAGTRGMFGGDIRPDTRATPGEYSRRAI